MSIASYRRNVQRRVTGHDKPTCLPAALEQVSPNHGYLPSVYRFYREWDDWYAQQPYNERLRGDYNPEYEDMLNKLIRPLGGLSCRDAIFSRATTPIGFKRVVRPLLEEGYRVVADLTYSADPRFVTHSVGILPTGEDGFVTLVSNHVHKRLAGIVTLHKVGEHIAVGEDRPIPQYPFNDSNIMALPPAH